MATSRRAARKRLAKARAVLEDGALVTLSGVVRVVAGRSLVAPLSARPCVLHEVIAEIVTHRRIKSPRSPFNIHAREMVAFELVLDDGTAVLVDGEDADLALEPSVLIPRPLDREGEFLEARGLERALVRYTSFEEIAIAPGDRVAVYGMLLSDADPHGERDYREGSRRYRLVGQPEHPLTIGPA